MPAREAAHDQRPRHTFWIDNRIIDEVAPVMGRYPCGAAALAVYAVLARRAGRDGASWPRLHAIAEQVGVSERTVQRAVTLLELLGLVAVTSCFEAGSNRQTSNLYTLLPLPAELPALDPDPGRWPQPRRSRREVRPGARAQAVADGRAWDSPKLPSQQVTLRQVNTPSPAAQSPRPRQAGTPSPARLTPQEGRPSPKDNALKELPVIADDLSRRFTIAEIGLTNSQVWAATLAELARRGAVSATDLEAWLRPAALIGREGDSLILGVPNSATRDRISTRFLPAVRAALAQVLGVTLPVSVVVSSQCDAGLLPGGHAPGTSAAHRAGS